MAKIPRTRFLHLLVKICRVTRTKLNLLV